MAGKLPALRFFILPNKENTQMGKPLHTLLVVHDQLKERVAKMISETLKVFKGGQAKVESGPLKGIDKSYTPISEDGMKFEPVKKNLITTVPERLNFTFDAFEALFDHVATRDLTNTTAFADVEVDGTVILKHIPVDTLIEGQKLLTQIRELLKEIPTLDGSHDWKPSEKPGVWMLGPVVTYYRTKITKPLEMAPATKEHKAQIKEITEDVIQGSYFTKYYDGSMTSAAQEALLAECDKLIAAFKEAQKIANSVEVLNLKVGAVILGRLRAKLQ